MTDKQTPPAQHQDQQPGSEQRMHPKPEFISDAYQAADKLKDKVAIITGADSGIGRAVAVHFAREGAKVAMLYFSEEKEGKDARETEQEINQAGGKVLCFAGDVGEVAFCKKVVDTVTEKWGRIDVLVNNAGEQHPQEKLEDITEEQWQRTFHSNIYGMFLLTKAVLPHLPEGGSIINTTSVTAYKGNPNLIDYSATKGAIVAFTRSLALNLSSRSIRVNGVAPGPIWTPLIPSTFSADHVSEFGGNTPMQRPGQPAELAPTYVYFACQDSSYVSGQVLHVNGGTVVNG